MAVGLGVCRIIKLGVVPVLYSHFIVQGLENTAAG